MIPNSSRKFSRGIQIDLLTNARLLELAEIMFDDEAAGDGLNQQKVSSSDGASNESTKVYSWVDEDGKTHYSDEAPAE